MLDLEALAALDAVIREGGFARAAARLHRVQSAVSYQVNKCCGLIAQDTSIGAKYTN